MTTERKIYWSVGIVSLLLMLAAILFPADRPEKSDLPWHIEHPAAGLSKVFGLTLGVSSPADAEARFKEKAEFGLFRSPEGNLSAEAFFEQINLAGLKSRVVLTVQVEPATLLAIHDRGLRMSATGSGKKITLAPDDLAQLKTLPISSITLIPSVRIPDDLFEKRFGKPAQIVREANADVVHWLYPQHALDITTSSAKSGKQVLQYVSPGDYRKLLDPLLKNGGQVISP